MHSSDFDPGEKTFTVFHHNGDFSGDVIIVRALEEAESELDPRNGTVRMKVPFEHIKGIVFEHLRRERIEALENMTDAQLEEYFLRGSLP